MERDSDQPSGSWRAKNANSIKIRSSDGQKHPVETRKTMSPLPTESAALEQVRTQARREAADRAEARMAARRAKSLEGGFSQEAAVADHTPEGWVPANHRNFVDPFAKELDPRRNTTPGQRAPKPKHTPYLSD